MKNVLSMSVLKGVCLSLVALSCYSCMSMDTPSSEPVYYKPWMYNFANEVQNPTTTITIVTDGTVDLDNVQVEIPPLKYNKELLFLLSQDDSRHSTLCYTWAMINGRPFGSDTRGSDETVYFYHIEDLLYFNLDNHPYKMPTKTLGCTDGAGNEVRFNFSMTINPTLGGFDKSRNRDISKSDAWSDETATRTLIYKDNDSSISWNDARFMINYGVGVSFHDVDLVDTEVHDQKLIADGLKEVQQQLLDSLNGRGSKMLCEPNGNDDYLLSAKDEKNDLGIVVLTAQENADLYLIPAQVNNTLDTHVIHRDFRGFGSNNTWVDMCDQAMAQDFSNRKAISIGVHGTCSAYFYDWLKGVNDKYGKDGSDVIWMPSQDEYYEYNYYRQKAEIKKHVEGNTLKLTVKLPTGNNFYYPATTLNLVGVDKTHIVSVESDDVAMGMSYANYKAPYGQGFMINIDCRQGLTDLVRHFVQEYVSAPQKKIYYQWDAEYFAKMLKPGPDRDYQLELCQ